MAVWIADVGGCRGQDFFPKIDEGISERWLDIVGSQHVDEVGCLPSHVVLQPFFRKVGSVAIFWVQCIPQEFLNDGASS